jgi:hypothetical protein
VDAATDNTGDETTKVVLPGRASLAGEVTVVGSRYDS